MFWKWPKFFSPSAKAKPQATGLDAEIFLLSRHNSTFELGKHNFDK